MVETATKFRARLRAMGIEPRRVGPYTWTLKDGADVLATGTSATQEQARTDARAAFDALPPRADGKRRRADLVTHAARVKVGRS